MPPPPPPKPKPPVRPRRDPTGPLPRMPPPPAVIRPPSSTGTAAVITARGKLEVANAALVLRDEQIRAKVKYYNAHQRTNAELDKITEAVVAELQALRIAGEDRRPETVAIQYELIQSLQDLLETLFSAKRRNFIERKIRDIQRRITQLFFNSELYAQLAEEAGEVPAAAWPEQALYYAMKLNETALLEDLRAMPMENEEVRERAIERLNTFTRQLCADFLSRSTPELERLLGIYRDVLSEFFYTDFGAALPELCRAVVKESRVASGHQLGYKITKEQFPAFRAAFDKHFLNRLVFHVQDPIMKRAGAASSAFRNATLQFVADPRIHSEICEVINDAVYDYLHGEGFLDLPPDWRRVLQRG